MDKYYSEIIYNKKVTGCNGLILQLLTGEMEDFDSMSDEVLFRLYFFLS